MPGDFIDTNVILYLFDEENQDKRQRSEQLVRKSLETGTGVVSFQVVQEALNVVTTKLKPPITTDKARRLIDKVLVPMWRVMPSRDLYYNTLDIQARYGYGYYDSQIIAAAMEAGCDRLLSEDLQEGQRIGKLRIVNPYLS